MNADTIKLAISEIEAGVTDHTTAPDANTESAETETVLKGIQRPANILQNIIPVGTKISMPMSVVMTHLRKTFIPAHFGQP